ncbi:hypothetical protein DFH07DRAFT_811715 [Mycena maculata]|uniref:Uncharacterized protein n=1 Tax=Mycena maculata TaxID=230809 RepID=A0AAD7JK97_9AGAR|nr:hypothetical protein DFH07DRAFT_811715 [Mycena maculata]
MSIPADPEALVAPLELYASYPFTFDDDYQNGLATIIAGGALDNDPPEEIRDEILRRTRVFYFNRVTGNAITMDEAREYELSHKTDGARPDTTSPAATAEPISPDDAEPVVLSFAQLQALIEAGKEDQIPNNKVIPDDLNDAAPSASAAPVRRKPWEVDSDTNQAT